MGPILNHYLMVDKSKLSNEMLRHITLFHVLLDKGDLKNKLTIGGGCEYISEL